MIDRIAKALWAADVKGGDMFTRWDDLGEPGQDAYRRDAKHFIEVAPMCGIDISEQKEDQ